jgi:deoxyribonuclease (pyrimidine dimer)
MTRINVVPPEVLSDKHLLAEYRMLPRVFTAVKKLKSKPSDIPEKYCLGTGHVKFFYDKCEYLMSRYTMIYRELLDRNVEVDYHLYRSVLDSATALTPYWALEDYTPDHEAMYLNMARLVKRSKFQSALDEMRSDA